MTNHTPHPTDAMPLPSYTECIEIFNTASAKALHIFLGCWEPDNGAETFRLHLLDAINEARREGYELAMSRISELLSNMDRGVLRMPRDLALHGEMAQVQFYGRVQMLLDRIEALAAPTPNHSPSNMTQPIHDPAVTTPREVLVGESPVDRIAAPAQEQSVEDEAQALIDAGHAFWNSCKSLGGGAVRWLQCEDGTLIIFTRGEYRERLMSRICADCSAPQYVYQSGEWQALSAEPKQQAVAAEVSDEQLWASDEVMAINAELGLPMEKLARLARVLWALKAGGVA